VGCAFVRPRIGYWFRVPSAASSHGKPGRDLKTQKRKRKARNRSKSPLKPIGQESQRLRLTCSPGPLQSTLQSLVFELSVSP